MFTFLACCGLCRDGDDEPDWADHLQRHQDYQEGDDDDFLSDDEAARLIMNAANRRKKTYGTRAAKTSTRAHGIFGANATPTRAPLDDITNALANVILDDAPASPSPSKLSSLVLETSSSDEAQEESGVAEDLSTAIQEQLLLSVTHPVVEAVKPLQDVYQKDRDSTMMIMTWEEILTGSTTIGKIAEASFAQVFRVSNEGGSSILKFIELKTPYDPNSMVSETAADIETVIPEFRLMNALAEVPGFLNFKDAHIVMGKPPLMIQRAYDSYITAQAKKEEGFQSWFPSPDSYAGTAIFLALELGDAGTVLEDVEKGLKHEGCLRKGLEHVEWVWDILLGVVIALSRAEQLYMFEHRDLHENNICVKLDKAVHVFAESDEDDDQPKLGRSGLELTILDYGLSRATLNGEAVFFDLESDLELFQSDSDPGMKLENLQYETYRRMRNHLFSGKFGVNKSNWHNDESRLKSNGHSWKESIPYTNVLWINYIFEFLREAFIRGVDKQETKEQRTFRTETRELAGRLRPGPHNLRRFMSATDVLEYVVEQGWVTEDQLEEYGAEASDFQDED